MQTVELNETLNNENKEIARCLEYLRTLDKRLIENRLSDDLTLFLIAIVIWENWLAKKWHLRFSKTDNAFQINDFRDGKYYLLKTLN